MMFPAESLHYRPEWLFFGKLDVLLNIATFQHGCHDAHANDFSNITLLARRALSLALFLCFLQTN